MRAKSLLHLTASVALLGAGACKPIDDAMVLAISLFEKDGRSMRNQPSFDPYENTRMPAEGSVPFAAGNYTTNPNEFNTGHASQIDYDLPAIVQPIGTTLGDRSPGNPYNAMQNPVPAEAPSLERGQVLYERACAICHGPAGDVMKAPVLEKLPMMVAYNLVNGPATGFSDGYIYGMIREGRGIMPSYGHQIAHHDRWHLVNYVRSLQRGGAAPVAPPAGAAPATPPQQERED